MGGTFNVSRTTGPAKTDGKGSGLFVPGNRVNRQRSKGGWDPHTRDQRACRIRSLSSIDKTCFRIPSKWVYPSSSRLHNDKNIKDRHHYVSSPHAQKPLEYYQSRDKAKRKLIEEQGITLITVPCWWDGRPERFFLLSSLTTNLTFPPLPSPNFKTKLVSNNTRSPTRPFIASV